VFAILYRIAALTAPAGLFSFWGRAPLQVAENIVPQLKEECFLEKSKNFKRLSLGARPN